MLPYTAGDTQQLQRKRHIGNDIVAIVFQVTFFLFFFFQSQIIINISNKKKKKNYSINLFLYV